MRPWRRAVDDRGLPWPACDRPSAADSIGAGLSESLAAAVFKRDVAHPAVFGVAVGLALFGVPFLALELGAFMPLTLGLVVSIALAIALAWAARRWLGFGAPGPDRPFWLVFGLCPACGYCIAEIEPEADNCRVCPECGSAWKLDNAQSSFPP